MAIAGDTHRDDQGNWNLGALAPSEQRLRHAPLRDLATQELAEAKHRELIDHRMFEVEAARRTRTWG